MFWAIVHLYYEVPANQLCCIWLNLGREYIPIHFRINPTVSVFCHVINKNPVPLEAMHAHAITPCFTDDVVCFELWAVPSLRHTFFLPVILVQVDLNFSRPKNAFADGVWVLQSLIRPCMHLVVNPLVCALVKSSLDCRLWQWHVYLLESVLHLAGCCERVFLHHEEDPIINHYCPPWSSQLFYVAELTSALFVFSQNLPNCWFGHSETSCYLSNGFVLFLKHNNCFTSMETSFDCMVWVHSNSFQMQMESAPDLLPI